MKIIMSIAKTSFKLEDVIRGLTWSGIGSPQVSLPKTRYAFMNTPPPINPDI